MATWLPSFDSLKYDLEYEGFTASGFQFNGAFCPHKGFEDVPPDEPASGSLMCLLNIGSESRQGALISQVSRSKAGSLLPDFLSSLSDSLS